MNFELYESTRQLVSVAGTPLSYLIIALCGLIAVVSVVPKLNIFAEKLAKYQLVLLGLAYALLIYFHVQIYRAVEFTDSFTGLRSGIAAPLWIENEKLFFWAALFFLFVIFGPRKPEAYRKTVLFVGAVFLLLTTAFDSPFNNPLPGLHSEITGFVAASESGDANQVYGSVQQISARAKYFYNTTYMWIHPPLLFISYGVFALSFFACFFMLRKKEQLLDKIAYDYAKFGYLLLTLGILLGYPWAVMAWKNEPWWWAPKINMSIMTWLLYSAYLHSRIYLQKRGMWSTTAILGLVAFAVLILTYLTTYAIPGTHSYG